MMKQWIESEKVIWEMQDVVPFDVVLLYDAELHPWGFMFQTL